MSFVEDTTLADVQAEPDDRGVALDAVGISDLRQPLEVGRRDGSLQSTICTAELAVQLPASARGTHMSRFVEVLHGRSRLPTPAAALDLAHEIATRLDADAALVRLAFPLFVSRPAPVTGHEALLGIDCILQARAGRDVRELLVGVRVPVTSLCPCSKEIADYSAHSQRGHIDVEALDSCWSYGKPGLFFEDLLDICDAAASAPIYPLLKRQDERYVTMLAYDQPAFVEDLAREVALRLRDDERVGGFSLQATNQESIHDHQAIARLSWRRS